MKAHQNVKIYELGDRDLLSALKFCRAPSSLLSRFTEETLAPHKRPAVIDFIRGRGFTRAEVGPGSLNLQN